MLSYEVEQANFDSWARTALLFEQQPDDETWIPYKEFMRRIFQHAAMELVCSYFRAGQSMHHLIFSTCEKDRLESYDPVPLHVTVVYGKGNSYIAAGYQNLHLHEPIRKTPVTSENVWPVLKSYLTDLWQETRPDEPLPKPLA